MAGKDNLRVPTSEEARENGRKGGLASAKARKRRRDLRELGLAMLEGTTLDERQRAMLNELDLDDSYGASLMLSMVREAEGGSVEAARFVRDTVGQAPKVITQVINGEGMTPDDLRNLSDEELMAMLDAEDDSEDDA